MAILVRLRAMNKTERRQRYKKSLNVIPYFFTYLNAIFGFLSILKALDGYYITAAYYIMLAAFMDAIDGRLARALGSTSYFGMELDSLCDAISFCLAPTVLLYCWYPDPVLGLSKFALVVYLCLGLFRLARFNVTAEKQQSYFLGLPTPIAAFFVASLVLYDTWIATHWFKLILSKTILFSLVAFVAVLMVLPIKFYSFKRYKLSAPYDYVKLLIALLAFSLAVAFGYPLLFLFICLYIMTGIIKSLYDMFVQLSNKA